MNGHGIQGENYAALLSGNKMSAWCHYRNWMLANLSFGFYHGACIIVLEWLAKQKINAAVGYRFSEGESCDRLFSSAIVNLLLRANGERGEGGEVESPIL